MQLLLRFYIWLFCGTPALLQIVFAFNVLPSFGIVLPGTICGILALELNEGADVSEIMRIGIGELPVFRGAVGSRRSSWRCKRGWAGDCEGRDGGESKEIARSRGG